MQSQWTTHDDHPSLLNQTNIVQEHVIPNNIGQGIDEVDSLSVLPSPSSLDWLAASYQPKRSFPSSSCSNSPIPSPFWLPSVTDSHADLTASRYLISSEPTSTYSSPRKTILPTHQETNEHALNNGSDSITSTTYTNTLTKKQNQNSGHLKPSPSIRVFAQTLSQDVEYLTLHLDSETPCKRLVRSLLKKFRLKHRDPNLFFFTLERWIRKDGLKTKSVMLLGDDACPLQLQQCCSSPPHNDIKFTLQSRAGSLMRIHCSDVCPNTRYKSLSLSTRTTVDEAIELVLHCLNLHSSQQQQQQSQLDQDHSRQASSPTGSSSSSSRSSSSTSSSSGVESDPTNQPSITSQITQANTATTTHQSQNKQFDLNSRTSSITSISSTSNISHTSISIASDTPVASNVDQYCLVIECENTNYRRVLNSDELLVETYQDLIQESRMESITDPAIESNSKLNKSNNSFIGASNTLKNSFSSLPKSFSAIISSATIQNQQQTNNDFNSPATSSNGNNSSYDAMKQQPERWFVIKLKRKDSIGSHHLDLIRITNPHKQNVPLPPIPLSLQLNNANELRHIVSTTQIEVNNDRSKSAITTLTGNSLAATSKSEVTKKVHSSIDNSNHNSGYNNNTISNTGILKPLLLNSASPVSGTLTGSIRPTLRSSSGDNNGRTAHQALQSEIPSLVTDFTTPSTETTANKSDLVNADVIAQSASVVAPIGQSTKNESSTTTGASLYGNYQQIQQHYRQMSAICIREESSTPVSATATSLPPPPASLILLPRVRPRKRNLSNASTTFQKPTPPHAPPVSTITVHPNGLKMSNSLSYNRRRYDPLQLARDLNELNLSEQS